MRKKVIAKKKIYVGMSGGVDSSVAAALLKKEGHDVVGVFMKPWQPEQGDFVCLWQKDREDAMRVASQLGIPLLTWDFSEEYKKAVTDYMIREYAAGRTPNPDVMCNKEIKFGLFLDKAIKEGADLIATGHYVRLIRKGGSRTSGKYQLHMAVDKNKDQSYFLWTLKQEQLQYCLFPIGEYTKPEIRKLAKKFNLPTHSKKDSQGVCFVGPLDMKEFLKYYIKPEKGEILDLEGNKIGTHDGVYYYTIGQRHGLDIKNGQGPYYVIEKDVKNNVIYVGSKDKLSGQSFKIGDTNWINSVSFPRQMDVRIRYRAGLSKAKVDLDGGVNIKGKETAISSGQSAVFYRGTEMLGGGIII